MTTKEMLKQADGRYRFPYTIVALKSEWAGNVNNLTLESTNGWVVATSEIEALGKATIISQRMKQPNSHVSICKIESVPLDDVVNEHLTTTPRF